MIVATVVVAGLTTIALAFTSSSTAASKLSLGLHWRNLHEVRLLVPDGWRFKNASYPSDHATYKLWDPGDIDRHITVIVSACYGCVMNSSDSPAPAQAIPVRGLISRQRIDPWTLYYTGSWGDYLYANRGVVLLKHQDSEYDGVWARADVWLPRDERRIANRIIASLRFRQ